MTQGKQKFSESAWRDSTLKGPPKQLLVPAPYRQPKKPVVARLALLALSFRWQFGLALCVVLVLFGLATSFDERDSALEGQVYCANVYDGVWPDYRGTYRSMCHEGLLKSNR